MVYSIKLSFDIANWIMFVKKNGYALDHGELFEDVRCIGAPVYDGSARVFAAISLSGPIFRVTDEKIEGEYISAVKDTAFKISQKLGYLK